MAGRGVWGMAIRIHFIIHFIAQRTEKLTDCGSDGLMDCRLALCPLELNMQNS